MDRPTRTDPRPGETVLDLDLDLDGRAGPGAVPAGVRGPVPAVDPAAARIEPMRAAHAADVLAVYQCGLDTGDASFETVAPDWPQWDADHLAEHRMVAVDPDTGAVLGWTALRGVSDRCVYRGVVEESVYVHPAARGHGVGRRLLAAVLAATDQAGIWTVQTGIFPENTASLALHRAVGFRMVGRRERIGQRHGVWRDVLFLERRSPTVG